MAHQMAEPAEESSPLRRLNPWVILRGVMFLMFALSLLGGLHYYIGSRLTAGLSGGWAVAGWSLVALLFLSIPLGFIASRLLSGALGKAVYWVAHLWLGAFGPVLSAVALTDLIRLAATAVHAPDAAHLSLWGGVQAGAILALVVPAIAWGYRTARGKAKVEKVRVPIANLGKAMDGLRIVQISDVHIGETLDGAWLRRVVEQVNALDPDVVAITGDLVDGPVAKLRGDVAPLAELKAREGVYYVTGNHEYYWGGPAWEAEVRRLGITVLHNEHRVLRRGSDALVVAGVTDLQGGQFDPSHACRPDLALQGAPAGAPKVLLAHQPKAGALAQGLGVDLQLSGHTHGGQIFPFMFFVRLQQPMVSGLKKLFGTWVYTSRGIGYWGPPLRVGPSPEITELTLVAA